MPQHIGNAGTKAVAWVQRIVLRTQARRAKELKEFVEGLRSLFEPGEPLDMATRGVMESFFGYDLREVRIHRGQKAEEASRRLDARAFTFAGHIFTPRQNLDSSTTGGLGLLAHELTHVIQQTQPQRLPQGRMANRDNGSALAAPSRSQSHADMVLLAPAKAVPLTASPQQREAQAQASEQLMAQALADNETKLTPQINPEVLADKVYRLMRYDMRLEQERRTKLGG